MRLIKKYQGSRHPKQQPTSTSPGTAGERQLLEGMAEVGLEALLSVLNGRRVAVQCASRLPYILDRAEIDDNCWQPIAALLIADTIGDLDEAPGGRNPPLGVGTGQHPISYAVADLHALYALAYSLDHTSSLDASYEVRENQTS
jgi:hypothetical protein